MIINEIAIFTKPDDQLTETERFRKQFGNEPMEPTIFAQKVVDAILKYEIITDEEVFDSESAPDYMIRAPFDEDYFPAEVVREVEKLLRNMPGVNDHMVYIDGFIEVYLEGKEV